MPFTTSMIWWTGSEIALSGFGFTSTGAGIQKATRYFAEELPEKTK